MNSDNTDYCQQDNKSPLCVFRISPTLSIQLLNRPAILSPSRLPSTKRRSGVCSKIQIKPRFKQKSRRSSHKIAKYLLGHVTKPRREALSLNEVLDTLKQVWISPNSHSQFESFYAQHEDMTDESKKFSSTSSEISSPIILRRRLSAPETIMRKHMLAQQRLDDSDGTQMSETSSFHWRTDIGSSDQNLYKKRDVGIRKSTLLRRLWSNNKSLSERRPRLPFDWQYSTLKVYPDKYAHSSTQSSPEHKKLTARNSYKSPKKQLEQKQKLQVESASTRSTEDNNSTSTSTTSYATYSDNGDSMFSYSKVSTSTSTCDTCENNNKLVVEGKNSNSNSTSTTDSSKYEPRNEATQTADVTNLNIISNVQLSQSTINSIFNHVLNDLHEEKPRNADLNQNQEQKQKQNQNQNRNQNQNHIENELSISNNNVLTKTENATVINVQEVPSSFYLQRNNNTEIGIDESRLLKYMISNVGTGNYGYGKPAEVPQVIVPRYSAQPRTSSMEVNTSSGDGTDKESDTLSLVDSLEDPTSPRTNERDHSRQNASPLLLPDNSKKRKRLKPATFYVPIETDAETDIKPVAEHLPAKVKEKLWKRQVKREEKMAQTKTTLLTALNNHSLMVITNDSNGNFSTLSDDLNANPKLKSKSRTKSKSKPVLPSIERNYKHKEDKGKSVKRKSVFVSQGHVSDAYKCKMKPGSHLSLRMRHKPEKLTPIYGHASGPKRTCNQHEIDSKRIEILEIVECIHTAAVDHCNTPPLKGKSKIPVLMKPKGSKAQQQSQHEFAKPYYLDFDQSQMSDPKIDQLIANILIDSLNISQGANSTTDVTIQSKSQLNESRSTETFSQIKHSTQQRKNTFAVIPEEVACQNCNSSKCNSFEENVDKAAENSSETNRDESEAKDDEAAAALHKDENSSSLPKGWITFYMLHKQQDSPDSTSDEGTNKNEISEKQSNPVKEEIHNDKKQETVPLPSKSTISHHHQRIKHLKIESSNYNVPDSSRNSLPTDSMSSSESDQSHSHNSKIRQRKKSIQNANRHKNAQPPPENANGVHNQWSVTVSSTNNYGQFAPDVEMRLKFPGNGNGQDKANDGLFARDHFDNKSSLPYLQNKPETRTQMEHVYSPRNTKLPKIKNTSIKKRSESNLPIGIMLPAKMEPRQTRTSSRRYFLNRQYTQFPGNFDSEAIMALREENRQLCEILKRLPTLLKVTGSAISPERKPRVTTMTERDLTRNLYINHQ